MANDNKNRKGVDDYLAGFSKGVQTHLKKMRETIKKASPGAQEKISYGIPGYELNGMLVWFAAHRNHIGFYPRVSGMVAFKKELSAYRCATGSAQFPFDRPLPLALVSKIVKFRVQENLNKKKKPELSTKPVIQKLGLKTGHNAVFLHVPAGLAPILKTSSLRNKSKLSTGMDFLLAFYESPKALKTDLKKISKNLVKTGMAWVCWKKGGVTELSRDLIGDLAKTAGLDTVASCSIDDDWSALKLMFPKGKRL